MVTMADSPVTAFSLRERLTDLVEGKTTLDKFDEWFAVNTWDDSNVSIDARQLACRVELILSEFSSGHWTWGEVLRELRSLTQSIEVTWGGALIRTTGANVSELIRVALPAERSDAASIQYAEVCA